MCKLCVGLFIDTIAYYYYFFGPQQSSYFEWTTPTTSKVRFKQESEVGETNIH